MATPTQAELNQRKGFVQDGYHANNEIPPGYPQNVPPGGAYPPGHYQQPPPYVQGQKVDESSRSRDRLWRVIMLWSNHDDTIRLSNLRVVVVVRLLRRLVAPLRAAPAAFSLPSSPRCASPSPVNDSSQAETSTTSPVEKRASPILMRSEIVQAATQKSRLLQQCLCFATRTVEDFSHLVSAFNTWFRRAGQDLLSALEKGLLEES
ncbi:hypothetical protein R1flu_009438 [Riccia fluitans]|uniref:Uncharacterized protein n=1 Tax=Riccia fluitans TaxID=41844 RepID=A0ABD1Z2I1_9MARC